MNEEHPSRPGSSSHNSYLPQWRGEVWPLPLHLGGGESQTGAEKEPPSVLCTLCR